MMAPSFIKRLARSRAMVDRLLILAAGILFLSVDVLGLGDVTMRHSLRAWNILVDTWDWATARGIATRFQDRSVVVLMTDHDLEEFGEPFPPRGRFHAEVVRNLIEARPAAIFIDFIFGQSTENRDDNTLDELWSILAQRESREPRVPIIVGALSSAKETRPPLHRDLESLIATEHVRVAHVERIEPDSYLQRYRLVGPSPDDIAGAAFELYQEFCKAFDSNCGVIDARKFAADLSVLWSSRIPTDRSSVFGDCSSSRNRVGEILMRAFAILIGGPFDLRCPYTRTMSAEEIRIESKERLRDLIASRVVLYGGHVSVAPDVTLTPLHGSLPGVFTHAMALDNLMAWGPSYYRAAIPGWDWINELAVVEIVMLAASLALAFIIDHISWVKLPLIGSTLNTLRTWKKSEAFVKGLAAILVGTGARLFPYLVLFILIITIEVRLMHLAPMNWVGLGGIIVLGELCERKVARASAIILLLYSQRTRRRLCCGIFRRRDARSARKMVRVIEEYSPTAHRIVAVRGTEG